MVLPTHKLKRLFHGVCCFDMHDDYLVPRRFTPEIREKFEDNPVFRIRSLSTGMVEMRFTTDADSFSFDYRLEEIVHRRTMDVYINDTIDSIVSLDEFPDERRFTCSLPEGTKKVCVCLPCYCCMTVRNFEVNGMIRAVPKPRTKVLWIGDSITQGSSEISSLAYVGLCRRKLGWNVLDQGIGGVSYDERLIMEIPGFKPDKIIVALGTNSCKAADFAERAEEFYAKLASVYPQTKILAITPLWRGDAYADYLTKGAEAVRAICARFDNVDVVDGFSLVPHPAQFFIDGTHPTELGMTYYAENLMAAIRKLRF